MTIQSLTVRCSNWNTAFRRSLHWNTAFRDRSFKSAAAVYMFSRKKAIVTIRWSPLAASAMFVYFSLLHENIFVVTFGKLKCSDLKWLLLFVRRIIDCKKRLKPSLHGSEPSLKCRNYHCSLSKL